MWQGAVARSPGRLAGVAGGAVQCLFPAGPGADWLCCVLRFAKERDGVRF